MDPVYLDWAATTPPDPEILEQAGRIARTLYGNPSSLHRLGREAESFLSASRLRLARLLGCSAGEVIFTSGATESNNMILFSLLPKAGKRELIISGIEHSSIHQPAQKMKSIGLSVKEIPAGRDGFVDPDAVTAALNDSTAMVALMLVNNETGAIQPVAEVARSLRAFQESSGRRIHLHTDAVQAFGKIPFQPLELGVDSASISGHKIGGPRGVGALFLRNGVEPSFLFCGGGQERNRRPGTENLPGIAGLVAAAEAAEGRRIAAHQAATGLMARLIDRLKDSGEVELLPPTRSPEAAGRYSPFILDVAFPPIPGEVLVRIMEEEHFIISAGSACARNQPKKGRTRVLEGMQVPPETARGAVRISLGFATRLEELEAFTEALLRRVRGLRRTVA